MIEKREFQFGFTDNHELLSGIAIWSLSMPSIFIFNTSSHMYSSIDIFNSTNDQILVDIDQILNDIRTQKMQVYIYFRVCLNLEVLQKKKN